MNEERIFLTDYIEKFRTAYHQARAAFELYGNALESEKKNWQNELQRGWNNAQQRAGKKNGKINRITAGEKQRGDPCDQRADYGKQGRSYRARCGVPENTGKEGFFALRQDSFLLIHLFSPLSDGRIHFSSSRGLRQPL